MSAYNDLSTAYRDNGIIPVDLGVNDAILRAIGHSGSTFWVDSITGSNGNDGLSPASPVATIDYAVGLCTANKGDVIFVMPGHAENISAATSLVADVAGITIRGLGNRSNRPTLTYTATAGKIAMNAANTRLSNVRLVAGIASIVNAISFGADDVEVDHCELVIASTGLEFLQMLDVDAVDNVEIHHNRFIAENIAGTNTGIRLDATAGTRIYGNEFRGDWTVAAISGTTGSAAASTDVAVYDNIIENLDATAGTLLDHHDNTTGITYNNLGFTAFTTNITGPFDTGDTRCAQNFVVNLVDETAGVSPTTAST